MYRKKHYGKVAPAVNKENLDSTCLESFAREKLNTFSEDIHQEMVVHDDEFSGWANGNILLERVNRTQKSQRSPRVEETTLEDTIPSRIFAKRDCRSRRMLPSQQTEPTECTKTGIYILKKQAEYLETESGCADPTSVDKSKFPKRQDLITPSNRPPVLHCYPTHNNFFSNREKYSEREINRKRIKNLRKLSLKYPNNYQNYASLLMSPNYCRQLMKETLAGRPNSGRDNQQKQQTDKRRHSRRMYSERTDASASKVLSQLENTRPRYIPSSFKKCRMNRRNNKSARSHVVDPQLRLMGQTAQTSTHTYNKIKGKPPSQIGPLDDLLKIRFPDFF